MMKTIILISFLFLSLIGCSSQSKNFTKSGELRLRGGVYGTEEWDQSLVLSRNSWFYELTLLFEVLLVKGDQLGPFESWLSASELSQARACEQFDIVLVYNSDADKITEQDFFQQARLYSRERLLIPVFATHLRLHPDWDRLSLQLYKPYGLCKKSLAFGAETAADVLRLSFPGFKEVNIH